MEKERKRTGILVIDTKKHPEHKKLAAVIKELVQSGNLLEGMIELGTVDMAQKLPLHEIYFQISSAMPEFVITLDLAGFELRTEGDGYSYNTIPCRMAHFLLGEPEKYREILAGEFNFSMFFYAAQKSCAAIQKEYPELLNVCVMDETDLKTAFQDFFRRGKIR